MRHLRYMNETRTNKSEDFINLLDDLFIEYADKYGFTRNDEENMYIHYGHEKNTEYTVLKDGSSGRYKYNIVIKFEDDFGRAGFDGYLSDEFKGDMEKFMDRLRKIGYRCKVDWEGGSIYTIVIL